MIKQEKIVEIRDRASIVEVVSDYVTLKKAGRNYMGLCPFHGEKTPSFTVNEEKGIFHCFGCGAGGSVFHFLMQHDQLSFPEAVERLGKRYGIAVERNGAGKPGAQDEREALYRLNERAAANYHRILLRDPVGKKALDYIEKRGIDGAMANRFMLGFVPLYGSGLLELLKKEQLSIKNALLLGLIGQRESSRFHEKFVARLMFPIIDAGGKIIAFGGRVLDQRIPKYLNSPDTPLFHKGSTLYGFYQAKEGIRRSDRVIVVEGYLDVIALHQFGIDYAVATLGTALTLDHVRMLSRYSKNVIALFDGDDAGRKAAARSFEVFVQAGLLGRAAFLPAGEDPDTFVRGKGKEALEQLLDRSIPMADYYFSWLEERYGKSMEAKSQIAGDISRLLKKVRNPFEVDLLVARAVDSLGIREELLRIELRNSLANPRPLPASGVSSTKSSDRDHVADRSLISLVLRFPEVATDVFNDIEDVDIRQCFAPSWGPIVEMIRAEWQEHGSVDVPRIAAKLDSEQAALIAGLAIEGETIAEREAKQMAVDCVAHLRRKYLRGLERNLRIAIRTAEEQQDENAKRERILEWQDIVRKERQLERRKLEPKMTAR